MAGAGELCRPIRGCGLLVLAMFPGLTPLGYGTTAPFGAKNGNPSYRHRPDGVMTVGGDVKKIPPCLQAALRRVQFAPKGFAFNF